MRSLLLFSLLLYVAACTKREPHVDAGPVQVPAATSIAAADPTDDPSKVAPKKTYTTFSVAAFEGDELVECVDFSEEGDGGGLPKLQKLVKDATKIQKPCAVTFTSKTAMATCAVSKQRDAGGELKFTQFRYRFRDVALSDRAMKECIEIGGNWEALDSNSAEYRAAKMSHSRRQLEKAAGQLNKQSDPSDEP